MFGCLVGGWANPPYVYNHTILYNIIHVYIHVESVSRKSFHFEGFQIQMCIWHEDGFPRIQHSKMAWDGSLVHPPTTTVVLPPNLDQLQELKKRLREEPGAGFLVEDVILGV